ncbi:MAG: bifunctional pyr operon transcriptional regulator/uracil phosphoribosyltransferase PyrR [gamma proteobacterium symbiont of Bathyaustriella thionipta]|nr:bifunctional pyr operon transcriptional regulator/uracil phosphoribosyltransferase PyrR [gamma proteobacterium symbiont of Bathyaustriella thionipta]MCU7949900.1 bifunctional pyr operon transcriptional regulator/uracil phosphoribosyltransferase PyrR [gamma proteobacterium symbiont of Bathyaustriella thionipta]MCU7954066.1 bifunctional pyr operon transcriptional regulator/uracil phosphoribosyltransferase PyrR [gamma proteobacterium symbiont of Bathyaustriella thionipta]MCU7956497.1 bifunctiona
MKNTSETKSSELNKPHTLERLLDNMHLAIKSKIQHFNKEDVVMIGIHTGGFWIAEKLYEKIGITAPLGSLNISFYRDDFTKIGLHPEVKPSQLPTGLDDKHIILVDDVLFTGRTVRAALNEIFDYGRPASVTLAVLLDRGGRELPIYADIIGQKVTLAKGRQIKLCGPEPLKLVQNKC